MRFSRLLQPNNDDADRASVYSRFDTMEVEWIAMAASPAPYT